MTRRQEDLLRGEAEATVPGLEPGSAIPQGARTRAGRRAKHAALAFAALAALTACATNGSDPAPTPQTPPSWGEPVPGWLAAAPADTLDRGPWWRLFGDPVLDDLVPRVAQDNQTVAGAAAAVDAARAAVRVQRAGLFPTLGLEAGATRSGNVSPSSASNSFKLGLGASWEPDLWGRVGDAVTAAGARAQASEADLAAATLSAQATLAQDYLGLREADAEIALLTRTVDAYQAALRITKNRYDAGVAAHTDVLQAQTQLANAQSDLAAEQRTRAQLQHALAVLLGQPPAGFALPVVATPVATVPAIPPGVPSTLLQRRPDVAAAERAVAAANADVGAARTAWFPAFTLSGDIGQDASRLADLFKSSATTWSFGVAVAQGLFDGGLRSAQVDAARASWRQSVASYRQASLTAFQEVEDALVAADSLAKQGETRRVAADAATQTEARMMNRYRAGQASYGDVVQAQVASLSAQRALLQAALARQDAAVQLVQAVGGGWSTAAPGPALAASGTSK